MKTTGKHAVRGVATIPESFKLAYNTELIQNRIAQVARQVSEWGTAVQEKTGDQLLCVCVLRGGVHFFSDLLRAITVSVEPAFCRTYAYSSTSNSMNGKGVRVSLEDVKAQGRSILLVDDICDTGATLKKLQNVFVDLGASEVKSAVLVHRQVEKSKFEPDWSTFEYQGDEWFVGYGMEDKNFFSNLPAVHTILR